MKKWLPLILVVGLVVLAVVRPFRGGGSAGTVETVTVKSPAVGVMGTFAYVVAVAGDEAVGQAAVAAAIDRLRYVDETMSDYLADSELSKVNRLAADGPVAVSDELFFVLGESVKYSQLSDGAFDVTVGPVVELWRAATSFHATA